MVSVGAVSDLSALEPSTPDTRQEGTIRLHVFYRVALLLPILGLALAGALQSGATAPELALAHGGRSLGFYPPFLMRGLIAYGIVLVWLYRQLRRRSPREFDNLLWQAPVAYTAVSTALLYILVLAHGQAAGFVSEHSGWIGSHLAVHLAVGYGYVALIVWPRNMLRASGYFVEDAARVAMSDDGNHAFSTNGS